MKQGEVFRTSSVSHKVMKKTVDVIIPSMKKQHAFECIETLKYIPFGIRLHFITEGKSWPEAVNIGIKESEGDVILIDDDIRLMPDTFKDFEKFYNRANIFGFKLLFPDGTIQHAGGFVRNNGGGLAIGHIGFKQPNNGKLNVPYYVCHVTASLTYIKRHVIEKLKGIAEDYEGYQFEDVDFSFRALKEGFRILFLPNEALHFESESKKNLPAFKMGLNLNYEELKRRFFKEPKFVELVESFPVLDEELVGDG